MKYIHEIDDMVMIKREGKAAKPQEAFGLQKWKIRAVKAIAVLRGKADAITYYEDRTK